MNSLSVKKKKIIMYKMYNKTEKQHQLNIKPQELSVITHTFNYYVSIRVVFCFKKITVDHFLN